MKKNGFVSTSLIYTFFILFLLLMLFLLNSYSRNRFLLEQYKSEIKESLFELSKADINLYVMVWNKITHDYDLRGNIPVFGYEYEEEVSYCKNNSIIEYNDGAIRLTSEGKDSCYAYFYPLTEDIILTIYTKETVDSEKVEVTSVPESSYEYSETESSCTKGTITFDPNTQDFTIKSKYQTECSAVCVRREGEYEIKE